MAQPDSLVIPEGLEQLGLPDLRVPPELLLTENLPHEITPPLFLGLLPLGLFGVAAVEYGVPERQGHSREARVRPEDECEAVVRGGYPPVCFIGGYACLLPHLHPRGRGSRPAVDVAVVLEDGLPDVQADVGPGVLGRDDAILFDDAGFGGRHCLGQEREPLPLCVRNLVEQVAEELLLDGHLVLYAACFDVVVVRLNHMVGKLPPGALGTMAFPLSLREDDCQVGGDRGFMPLRCASGSRASPTRP